MRDLQDFALKTVAAAEVLVGKVAQELVRSLAAARKLQPLHLGLAVPGLCHVHNPSVRLDPACAFCLRAGNVFAPAGMSTAAAAAAADLTPSPDLIKRYQIPILEILVDFADELLDTVHEAKGVDVEDVRTSMLDALRIHVRNAKAGPAEAVASDEKNDDDPADEAADDDELFDFLPKADVVIPRT